MTTLELQSPSKAKKFFDQKVAFTTGPVELSHMINERHEIVVVDVREAEDYEKGHIPGAINCPKSKWEFCDGLSKDKNNIVYCYTQTCHLAAWAALEFADNGYPVLEMEGGFAAWKESGLPIEQ